MNWRTFAIRHWKAILLLIQIGIVAASIVVTKAKAEPIDTPCGP